MLTTAIKKHIHLRTLFLLGLFRSTFMKRRHPPFSFGEHLPICISFAQEIMKIVHYRIVVF
jgi:hypothetical protein